MQVEHGIPCQQKIPLWIVCLQNRLAQVGTGFLRVAECWRSLLEYRSTVLQITVHTQRHFDRNPSPIRCRRLGGYHWVYDSRGYTHICRHIRTTWKRINILVSANNRHLARLEARWYTNYSRNFLVLLWGIFMAIWRKRWGSDGVSSLYAVGRKQDEHGHRMFMFRSKLALFVSCSVIRMSKDDWFNLVGKIYPCSASLASIVQVMTWSS